MSRGTKLCLPRVDSLYFKEKQASEGVLACESPLEEQQKEWERGPRLAPHGWEARQHARGWEEWGAN